MSKYKVTRTKDTVEICIQGGINAANGFSDFKVLPVQVVSGTLKTKQERSGSQQRNSGSSKAVSFAAVLDRAIDESQPADCYTVTYNANRQLQTYFYQPTREYTF